MVLQRPSYNSTGFQHSVKEQYRVNTRRISSNELDSFDAEPFSTPKSAENIEKGVPLRTVLDKLIARQSLLIKTAQQT